jgi:hypothetical protein
MGDLGIECRVADAEFLCLLFADAVVFGERKFGEGREDGFVSFLGPADDAGGGRRLVALVELQGRPDFFTFTGDELRGFL